MPIPCVRVFMGSNLTGIVPIPPKMVQIHSLTSFLNVVDALNLWNCSKPSYSAVLMLFWTKIAEILSANWWAKSRKSFPGPVVVNHASKWYLDTIKTIFWCFENILTPVWHGFASIFCGCDMQLVLAWCLSPPLGIARQPDHHPKLDFRFWKKFIT